VHQLLVFIDNHKSYILFRRGILCNILIDFSIPMNLVKLIKMCLDEKYSRVRVGKHLSDIFLL
jgi:hypothetical protein